MCLRAFYFHLKSLLVLEYYKICPLCAILDVQLNFSLDETFYVHFPFKKLNNYLFYHQNEHSQNLMTPFSSSSPTYSPSVFKCVDLSI